MVMPLPSAVPPLEMKQMPPTVDIHPHPPVLPHLAPLERELLVLPGFPRPLLPSTRFLNLLRTAHPHPNPLRHPHPFRPSQRFLDRDAPRINLDNPSQPEPA